MILKGMSSTPIGDGNRFSEKIMRQLKMFGAHLLNLELGR